MFIIEQSPWLILVGLIIGAGYAILLYRKKNPWKKSISIILSVARFILVFFLFFLLLDPLTRQLTRQKEVPTVIIALDNSTSISSVLDSSSRQKLREDLSGLGLQLSRKDLKVEYMGLNGKTYGDINDIPFDLTQTDISGLFSNIESSYEGKNIASVIMASDGIYTAGTSPVYHNYRYPVITIGIGDSLERNDISLRAIYNNKIVYQGNKFTMDAEIFNKGYLSKTTSVEISHKGKVIDSKKITFNNARGIQQVQFILDADEPGTQRYSIKVIPLEQELTTLNNSRESYLDIIEAREKILLLAHSPHPDIKAIRSVIEQNENYDLSVIAPDMGKFKPDQYSLVIYDQLPDAKGTFNDIISTYKLDKLPSLYIIGARTNLNALNRKLGWLTISSISSRNDNAFPVVDNSFSGFIISENEQLAFAKYPPLSAPFGEYNLANGGEVVLFQKIENLVTSRPLIAVSGQGNVKSSVIAGEGIWRWRLNEYLETNSHDAFNSFFLKLIQFTSSREDRRKFRVYPAKNSFWDSEAVEFETEAYNDVYERIYGQTVSLQITAENGTSSEYSYVTSETSTRFRISGMKDGVYNFNAKTSINGKNYSSAGMFTVQHQQVESINLTADFSTLRKLASKSTGTYINANDISRIPDLPEFTAARPVISASENISALINSKWIFAILLALITIEWVTRKYLGGY
jgi:hypothetical protein